MARVNNLKRITVEEFAEEDQEMAGKLAGALNPFLEQVSNAFNKNIDFDNLNQEIVQFEVTVGSTGIPTSPTEVRVNLKTRPRGLQVIRADNLSGTASFPTATPFITYDFSGSNIRILHVAGLPAGRKYNLSVLVLG